MDDFTIPKSIENHIKLYMQDGIDVTKHVMEKVVPSYGVNPYTYLKVFGSESIHTIDDSYSIIKGEPHCLLYRKNIDDEDFGKIEVTIDQSEWIDRKDIVFKKGEVLIYNNGDKTNFNMLKELSDMTLHATSTYYILNEEVFIYIDTKNNDIRVNMITWNNPLNKVHLMVKNIIDESKK